MTQVADQAMDQAFDWLATVLSGSATETEQQALAAWRAADARHEQAWQQLMQMQQRLQAVPPGLASHTLRTARAPVAARRKALRVLAWGAGMGVALYAGHGALQHSGRLAALRTDTGERREQVLADGSRVTLDTHSAVDLHYTDTERRLVLRAGAIHVRTAPDPAAAHRPFIVETPQGRLQALGTRFSVRLDGGGQGRDRVEVYEGAVAVAPLQGPSVRVQAGQWADWGQASAQAGALAPQADAAWVRGLLVAERMRLDDFVAELSRYRRGVLRCDPAVAGQIVSGVFSLDDTDATLASLQGALPVRVHRRTRWWVTVGSI
ncbi:MAG: FecR domain-containing protein [Burkholderiaceae bacterium]|jgi:transmembrane sensor|nr:FecR domain-containing protein [Burkholderiaceae bacterium]